MRTFTLVLVFALAGLATAALTAPLSFGLARAGLADRGVDWARAEGTLWDGRVVGLSFAGQPIGEARLKLQPRSALSGRLAYETSWTGPAGRGSGVIAAGGRGSFSARDLRVEADIAALEGVQQRLRQTGGYVRLRADEIRFSGGRCAAARGEVASDALTNAAAAFGRTWPEITGVLRCEDDMLVLPIAGEGAQGERLEAEARVGLLAPSSVSARVSGADAELENALALLGFGYEDDAYVYRREAVVSGAAP